LFPTGGGSFGLFHRVAGQQAAHGVGVLGVKTPCQVVSLGRSASKPLSNAFCIGLISLIM
jgi:hypothetical protein